MDVETPPFPDVEENVADQPVDMSFATLSALEGNVNEGFVNHATNVDWQAIVRDVNVALYGHVNEPPTLGSEMVVCEPTIYLDDEE